MPPRRPCVGWIGVQPELQSVRGIPLCKELQPLSPSSQIVIYLGSAVLGHLLQQDREHQNHPGQFAKRSDAQFHNHDIISASGVTQESAYLTSIQRHSGMHHCL